MNTVIKIATCTRASASAKVNYIENKTKADKQIILLEKNEMPPLQTLSLKDKKEIKSLQTKISIYSKRLEKAIEDGKEKSIKTNQKNILEAKKELAKFENREDKREKYFTEFTIALTNSKEEKYAEDWSKKTLEYIKQEFSTLEVISAVEHKGQHSPHMHIILHSKEKPITQVLAEHTGHKDTSRESMREAYSAIQHNFHNFANKNIAVKELETLKKGRKYVSLGQYKQKGNFEAKNALKNKKDIKEIILKNRYRNTKEYEQKLQKIINAMSEEYELNNNPFTKNDEVAEIAKILYNKTDNYTENEKNSSFEYVNIEEMSKIDIFSLLKNKNSFNFSIFLENKFEKEFIEANITQKSLLDIAKCFIEIGVSSVEKIIKLNYEKIKNYAVEAVKRAKDKNEFENLMQEKLKINYFRFDDKNELFKIQKYDLDLDTLKISAEKIINILDRNKEENEQMYEKQEKTSINPVSEPKNDKKEQSDSLANLEKMIDDYNKYKDEEQREWDKALAISNGTYVEETEKTSINPVSEPKNDKKEQSDSLANLEKIIDDYNKYKDEEQREWDKALAISNGTYVEETEKTPLNPVYEPKNDTKEQSDSLANLEKIIDDYNKYKDEEQREWDKALAIFNGTYVEETEKTPLNPVYEPKNDTKQETQTTKPHRQR